MFLSFAYYFPSICFSHLRSIFPLSNIILNLKIQKIKPLVNYPVFIRNFTQNLNYVFYLQVEYKQCIGIANIELIGLVT